MRLRNILLSNVRRLCLCSKHKKENCIAQHSVLCGPSDRLVLRIATYRSQLIGNGNTYTVIGWVDSNRNIRYLFVFEFFCYREKMFINENGRCSWRSFVLSEYLNNKIRSFPEPIYSSESSSGYGVKNNFIFPFFGWFTNINDFALRTSDYRLSIEFLPKIKTNRTLKMTLRWLDRVYWSIRSA